MSGSSPYIVIGQVTRAHNLKGEVRVRFFSDDPGKFCNSSEFFFENGGRFEPVEVLSSRPHKDFLLIRFAGCTNRNQAELLKGRELYIPRDALEPAEEGEFYYADLEQLEVYVSENGALFGTVSAVFDSGANTVLTVRLKDDGQKVSEWNIPFVEDAVAEVDIENGRISVRERFLQL